ncbi:hypothetical protein HYALB_00004764 [Hymenoscyphus albidus]|uniref:Uncharacterized protein n=1 Tax=Hymenoscyphus albidus TaxID=595503 RepID=A0A9N9Q0W8_9HELO|nr:hypothetical protein HYALB_00004764 [Hymenoscyphus albidus]
MYVELITESRSVVKRALFLPLLSPKKQETPSCLPFVPSKGIREENLSHLKVGNLDFDARVPIPFSIFPSSYRSDAVKTTEQTHIEGKIQLQHEEQRVGREGQLHQEQTSYSAELPPPRAHEETYRTEEVHITREDDGHSHVSRPGHHHHDDVKLQLSR